MKRTIIIIHLIFTETAINIGYSCKLLTDEMEDIYIVDGDSYDEVQEQLGKALQDMKRITKGGIDMDVVSYANANGTTTPIPGGDGPEGCGGFALVLNGHSLVSYSLIAPI